MHYPKPIVSVIVPTIGRTQFFTTCLPSLEKQFYKPLEVIIVDNSRSCEFKNKIISLIKNTRRLPLIYVNEYDQSAASARNTGIKKAKGNVLAFIDDDCAADINWLKNIVEYFIKKKNCVAVKGNNFNGLSDNLFSSVEYFNDELFFQTYILKKNNELFSPWVDTKNFAIKKSVFVKNKLLFNKRFRAFDDLAFSLELRNRNIPVYYSKDSLVYHFGRSNLFEHVLRDIKIGIDTYQLESRVNYKITVPLLPPLDKKYFTNYERWRSEKTIKNRLLSQILKKKKIFFKVAFFIFFNFSIGIIRFTYYLKKLGLL